MLTTAACVSAIKIRGNICSYTLARNAALGQSNQVYTALTGCNAQAINAINQLQELNQ